jgi:hypothetical protein
MSPANRVSNFHAIALVAVLLSLGCDRTETRTAPVTTNSPAGSSTAPSSTSAASRDEALVRVVHVMPFAPTMDVFAGDLVLFDAVNFKSVTSYRALDGKRYVFALRPAGMTNAKPLASNTEGLEDGSYYSVFALPGESRSVHMRVVTDKLIRPADGKLRLRIVHAGDGVDAVDVRATGTDGTLFSGVAFQTVSDYEEIAPVNGPLEIRAAGGAPVVTLPNAHLEAGRFYTLVLAGSSRSTPALEAFIIEDTLAPPPTTTR